MDREKIMTDIEKLQDETDEKGFKGQNEYDLYLRELIADYVVKSFVIGSVIGRSELLKCPFCGSDAEIKNTDWGNGVTHYQAQCKENEHSTDWWFEDKQKAIEEWNTRAF